MHNNLLIVLGVLLSYIFYKIIPWFITRRMLNRWNKTRKDLVILHAPPRGKSVPALSPFVLKLETYLKMANIDYKLDTTDPIGPKGKLPWISLNGTHMGDSQLIVEYLSKKLDKNLDSHYSDEQLAIGTAVRIMLEEHFFWGFRRWLFILEGRHAIREQMNIPPLQAWAISTIYGYRINKTTKAQGLGLHSDEEIQRMMFKELRSVSRIIGNKKFLLGDEPCGDDAAVFGFLGGFVFGHYRDSPYGKLISDELQNIEPYCIRMKEKFWPDWDLLLKP